MKTFSGVYVDGSWRDGSATEHIAMVDPSTEEVWAEVSTARASDVNDAVLSAQHAFPAWASQPLKQRIAIVQRVAALIQEHTDELVDLRCRSMGSPITPSKTLNNSLGLLDMYLETIQQVQFGQVRSDQHGTAFVTRRPIGVVAGIVPWNVPVRNELKKVIPSLLTGNTCVLKPSPESPIIGARLMDFFTEAGLPPGVLNLVTGGADVGEALVQHPGVQKIAFTGSTATGARIAELSAPTFKRIQLELGGKSAAIILPDANVADVAPNLLAFGFGNSGQICASLTRIFVPRDMQDALGDLLAAGAERHVMGNALDASTTLGPLVSQRQQDRVLGYIQTGIDEGATLRAGSAARPPRPGWFVEPTVFLDVKNDMTIAQEEIFGPVISVLPYDSVEQAINDANDSKYGLHGAVFSQDANQALRVAMQIETGTCAVNSFDVPINAPFGGVKGSGVGRENGLEGFDSYLEYHTYKVPEELVPSLLAENSSVA
jgi:aldehyde dehydrogenase (NAD+)